MKTLFLLLLCCCACVTCCSPAAAEDWPQFRGPNGLGLSGETGLPVEWSKDKNVVWRVELPPPGNNGSPIVQGGRVFLAIATDKGAKRSLAAFDASSGEKQWEKTVEFAGDEPTHGTSLYAGTTPATDGERVVVWHSSAGMHCYDLNGEALWSKDLGEFKHIWGYGASPIIYQDLVINNCGPGDRTLLVALDKKTGEIVWQQEEPGGKSSLGNEQPWIGSWSTPMIVKVGGQDQVIVSFPQHVKGYDPATGKELWVCEGLGNLVYTSPVIGEDVVIAMGGYGGPAIGFAPSGEGDITAARLWRHDSASQRIGSGVIVNGLLYMVNENGTVQCMDPQTGEEEWTGKLSPGGNFWASLIHAEGRLYTSNQQGKTVVFAADPGEYKELAVNDLGEPTNSTLAPSGGRFYHRTHAALYCIGAGE